MPRKITIEANFDENVLLLALVSQVKDYFLAFHLNELFSYHLERQKDIELELRKKSRTVIFSHYTFENEEEQFRVELFSNKYQGEFLIPELKLADFFLLLSGNFSPEQKENTLLSLKGSNLIQAMKETNVNELKSKENLIFY